MSRAHEDGQERNIGRAEAAAEYERLLAEEHKARVKAETERDAFRGVLLEAASAGMASKKREVRAVRRVRGQ